MEPQIHSAESFWWDSCPDIPPCGPRSNHCFRGPHSQDVEPAKDCSCQKVRMFPSLLSALVSPCTWSCRKLSYFMTTPWGIEIVFVSAPPHDSDTGTVLMWQRTHYVMSYLCSPPTHTHTVCNDVMCLYLDTKVRGIVKKENKMCMRCVVLYAMLINISSVCRSTSLDVEPIYTFRAHR